VKKNEVKAKGETVRVIARDDRRKIKKKNDSRPSHSVASGGNLKEKKD